MLPLVFNAASLRFAKNLKKEGHFPKKSIGGVQLLDEAEYHLNNIRDEKYEAMVIYLKELLADLRAGRVLASIGWKALKRLKSKQLFQLMKANATRDCRHFYEALKFINKFISEKFAEEGKGFLKTLVKLSRPDPLADHEKQYDFALKRFSEILAKEEENISSLVDLDSGSIFASSEFELALLHEHLLHSSNLISELNKALPGFDSKSDSLKRALTIKDRFNFFLASQLFCLTHPSRGKALEIFARNQTCCNLFANYLQIALKVLEQCPVHDLLESNFSKLNKFFQIEPFLDSDILKPVDNVLIARLSNLNYAMMGRESDFNYGDDFKRYLCEVVDVIRSETDSLPMSSDDIALLKKVEDLFIKFVLIPVNSDEPDALLRSKQTFDLVVKDSAIPFWLRYFVGDHLIQDLNYIYGFGLSPVKIEAANES